MAILEPAAEEFADLADDPNRLMILAQLARAYYLNSQNERTVEVVERVIVDAERTDQLAALADALVTKGSVFGSAMNRRHEGLALIDAGFRIAESNGFSNTMFRAINNAMSNRTEEEPRQAFDSAQAGLDMARRLGQAGWLHSLAANYAFVSLRVGEWDAGIAELNEALADATDPLERLLPLNNLVNFQALRGEDYEGNFAEMRAGVEADPSPSNLISQDECEAFIALANGRLREAAKYFRQLVDHDPTVTGYAATSARISIWLDDVDTAAADLVVFWEGVGHGGATRATRLALEAGLAGLRGDRQAASIAYRDALRQIRDLRLPFDEILLAVDMAYVLGPSDPTAAETITSARAIATGLRSKPLLDLIDQAVETGPPARLRTGSGAGGSRRGAEATSEVEARG
jgi:tetratricopeptide (TPR) repeat protein